MAERMKDMSSAIRASAMAVLLWWSLAARLELGLGCLAALERFEQRARRRLWIGRCAGARRGSVRSGGMRACWHGASAAVMLGRGGARSSARAGATKGSSVDVGASKNELGQTASDLD